MHGCNTEQAMDKQTDDDPPCIPMLRYLYTPLLHLIFPPSTAIFGLSLSRNFLMPLVHALKRRHTLTLCLIQGMAYHGSIPQINLSLRFLLEGQRMLHPFLIVSLGEVFSRVRTTRFLACCCCGGCLCSLTRC